MTDQEVGRVHAFDALQMDELRTRMAPTISYVLRNLPTGPADILIREHQRWTTTDTWQLINAADSCGT